MKRQSTIPKRLLMLFFAMMIIFTYPITCMAGSTDIQLYIQDDTAKSTENPNTANTNNNANANSNTNTNTKANTNAKTNTKSKTAQPEVSKKQSASTTLSAPKTEDSASTQTTKLKVLLTGSILCGTIGFTLLENEKKREKRGE
mgnify:CR=1 FL=1